MARNQKLINYHTGDKTRMPIGSNVDYGEIVVRHNAEAPELLIKIGDDSFGVFQASGAVKTAIDSAVSAAKTEVYDSATSFTTKEVNNVKSDLNELSGVVKSISTNIGENYVSKADFEEAQGKLFTSATTVASDDATAKANKAKEDAISAAAASATTLLGLVDAVDERVDTVSGDLNTFKTDVADTYETKDNVSTAITAAKNSVYSSATTAAAADAKTKADTAYSSATTAAAASAETLNNSIEAVDGRVDTVSGDLNTFKTDVADTYATKTGVTSDIKDAKDSVYLSATTAAAADAKTKADTAYSSATTAAAASAETLNNSIEAVDGKVGTLSGNVHTRIEGLKTDLTNTINEKVAVAYRYKGTKTNYADLPTSEMSEDTIGFVYNVENANGNYPAGTNYAWNGTEWDALGGSVDLSPYALKTEVSASAETLNNKIETVSGKVDTVSTSLETFKTTVANTYATKDELKSTSGSIITAYTNAIAAAKKEATDASSAYTNTQIAAAKESIKQTTDTISSDVKELSASTVTIQGIANTAIQNASIVDKDTCKVSVNKVDKELQFDFSNLVVDCGEF